MLPRFFRELMGAPIPKEEYVPSIYAIVDSGVDSGPVDPPVLDDEGSPAPEDGTDPEVEDSQAVTLLEDVSFPSDNKSQYITEITPESLVPNAPDYVKQILRLLIDAYGDHNLKGNPPTKPRPGR